MGRQNGPDGGQATFDGWHGFDVLDGAPDRKVPKRGAPRRQAGQGSQQVVTFHPT
jgi:hypothetical protein